ncbi:hypothetical protein C8J56DRAFT_911179 [Mycena floridula]|nr:hypothetical protein C8J56DRAFT_911179 [Mycena floridula]
MSSDTDIYVSMPPSVESSRPTSPTNRPPFRRAMASFDNLVSLANYQERLKDARKTIWRDRGEPVAELYDIDQCLNHAARGGLRAGTLAFSIKACLNLFLALLRIRSIPKDRRIALIRNALFGSDSWRFGAMLGTFVSTYKFLLNALPLLIPAMKPASSIIFSKSKEASTILEDETDELQPNAEVDNALEAGIYFPRRDRSTLDVPNPTLNRREARLSLSAHAQLVLIRKKTRRWHAALAGALAGGMSIMLVDRGQRKGIAEQVFVRGLQGSYNAFTSKRGITIPYGAVLVFSLACGQILYGALLRPDTLPRSYVTWFVNASKVPGNGINLNRGLVRESRLNMPDFEALMARTDMTPANRTSLAEFKELFLAPTPGTYLPMYAPCSTIHPSQDSCLEVPIDRFFRVFKWMLPIYGALHFIPKVLFKRKTFVKDPLKMLLEAAKGTGRSSAFLGIFVVIYQSINCINHNLHEYLSKLPESSPFKVKQKLLDTLLISKGSFWLPGFMAGLALFVEEPRRRAELAMYVLPKAMESAWTIGSGKVGVAWKGGEGILTAIGMAMVMSTYQNDPQHLSGFVRRILYQFIGPN